MAAARELFSTRGFAATTVAEIAERADVAKGSVFLHATSKEHLLVQVFQLDMHRWLDHAEVMLHAGSTVDRVSSFFASMLEQMGRTPELSYVFMRELVSSQHDPGVQEVMSRVLGLLGATIDAAKHRGEVPAAIDSFLLASNLFTLYFMHQLLWLGGGRTPDAGLFPSLRARLEVQLGILSPTGERQRRRGRRPPTD